MDWSVDRKMFFRNSGVVLPNLPPNLTLHLTPNIVFERTEFERKKREKSAFLKE